MLCVDCKQCRWNMRDHLVGDQMLSERECVCVCVCTKGERDQCAQGQQDIFSEDTVLIQPRACDRTAGGGSAEHFVSEQQHHHQHHHHHQPSFLPSFLFAHVKSTHMQNWHLLVVDKHSIPHNQVNMFVSLSLYLSMFVVEFENTHTQLCLLTDDDRRGWTTVTMMLLTCRVGWMSHGEEIVGSC